MGENSKIAWTHHTFNPWFGCTKVAPECDGCYAEALMAKRYGKVEWGVGKPRVRTGAANWRNPISWDLEARELGIRYRVFCASLADVFDNEVDQAWRDDLWALIRKTTNLDWLLLTKRIGNVAHMAPRDIIERVWLGITTGTQQAVDRDVEKLLRLPTRTPWLSIEPMLGPITFNRNHVHCPVHDFDGGFCLQDCGNWRRIAWVVCGGESNQIDHPARDLPIEHALGLHAECYRAGVAFFMKQGSQTPTWPRFKDFDSFPAALRVREFPR